MVNRHVVGGEGVVFAADVLGQILKSVGRKMFVPFKHEVLKKMREPAPLIRIVLRTDVIPNLDGDRRAGMILDEVEL